MATWGAFREQVVIGLLTTPFTQDVDFWTPAQLLTYCWWSLNALCDHTAIASSQEYAGDGATTVFDLPDNLYGSLIENGYVYKTDGTRYTYLEPTHMPSQVAAHYWVRPALTLHLATAPTAAETLHVDYYATYPLPQTDDDELLIPAYLYSALAYRIAAHAFTPRGIDSSNIDQYKTMRDKGSPEDNTWRAQQMWFLRQYEYELNSYPRQNRTNHRRIHKAKR